MRRVALLVCAVAFLACATNPVTGRPEVVFMSAEREAEIGRQEAAKVAAQIGLVEAPALVAYVDAIGQRLAEHSPRQDVPYRFAVADMVEPNAFALPGGYIYVSRGLLAIANSEDELANVVGHEIGHVAARHAAQRETRAIGVGVLSVLGTIAAGVAGGGDAAQLVSQLGQVAGAGLIASYGRDQERQSDELGQQMSAATGWDPRGMSSFLHTLERDTELRTGEKRLPSFLDSHPLTGERVAATAERAERLPVSAQPPIASDRADFYERLAGLLIGPDPSQGVFRDELFLHPALGFALEFPPGWKTVNQRSAVAAVSPEGDAYVALEFQGPSGNPEQASRSFAEEHQLELRGSRRLLIGGYRAVRAGAATQSQRGQVALDLTWIDHPEGMFRITGMSPGDAFRTLAPEFRRTANSFRSLASEERDGLTELRLRVVRARADEALEALSRRAGNRWTLEETAAANGLEAAARLERGQPVKIVAEVPYKP